MSVETTHPLYNKRKPQWEVIRDCYEGEDAIKEKGEVYLPRAVGSSNAQYNAYKKRARWVNYLGRTLNGLHGLMFRKYPALTCPDQFRYSGLLENVDRKGTSLNQFAADSVHDMMIPTFGGFLVDQPAIDREISVYEAEKKEIRPYIRYYAAESIINWKYGTVDGVEKLTLVVLKEEVEKEGEDEFAHDIDYQYRVLEIKNGVYRQRLFRKNGKTFEDVVIPVRTKQGEIDYIPFIFAPGEEPDRPMLLDLAYCNIGHYQKSADYENGVHLTTIPTGYVTGHAQDVSEDGEKEIINLGGDNFLMFPEADAKVGTLVYSGVGLLHSETALNMSMSEMAVLGSRLVSPDKNVSETADAAKIHRAGENALLATFAKNVSDCLSTVLTIMMNWYGIEGTVRYDLTTDYDTLSFDANAINALANLSSNEKMPLPYLYFNLKNGEYMPNDSSLEEYVLLLQLEKRGVDPVVISQIYREMKSSNESMEAKDRVQALLASISDTEEEEKEEEKDIEDDDA